MFFFFGGGESKHPSLPLARAERKPFDRKRKLPPRYQREKDFWFSFGTQKRTSPAAMHLAKGMKP